MKRSFVTILGIAIVAGVAIWLGRAWLKPASERAEASGKVLSGAYEVRIEVCTFLEDSELPEGLEPPEVGSDMRYLQLVVLFPEVASIKGKASEYLLDRVNSSPTLVLRPVHGEVQVEEDGVVLVLTFRTDDGFQHARLVRGEDVVLEQVTLP